MVAPSLDSRPVVLVTGATGDLGSSICAALDTDYIVVGLDHDSEAGERAVIELDVTSEASIDAALQKIRAGHGSRIAAVIHLIAYFDFTGKPDPRYDTVNVEGTRKLLEALGDFTVDRFIYASTMLVHRPGVPGERIDESWPIDPRWEYPKSKARAEAVIREGASMPCAILRFAGVYDEHKAVPTLSHQIARIYARDLQSHLYAGPLDAGQAMLHRADMIDAVRRTVERRNALPREIAILIGEPKTLGYLALQDRIGTLLHGERDWETLRIPAPVAKLGATLQNIAEPLVPDTIDDGEKPFVQPFMIDLADDHYALDISRARELLGWEPQHRLGDVLPVMIERLRSDPVAWHKANGVTLPHALEREGEDGERG